MTSADFIPHSAEFKRACVRCFYTDERIYVRSTLPVGTPATRTASRRAPIRYSSSPSRNRSRRRAGQRADMIQPSRVSLMMVTTLILQAVAGGVE